MPYPGRRSRPSPRTNSRKIRLTLLRRTASPNRFPTTMPTLVGDSSMLAAKRLNRPVDDRRPCRFTYSMSRVVRRKMPWSFSFGINKTTPRWHPIHEASRAGVVVAGRDCNEACASPHEKRRRGWTMARPSIGSDYALSRARPLARRRAMTLRPFLVLIRFRNPCSRFRLSLEGC